MESTLTQRILEVKSKIPANVQLLLASKSASPLKIREAFEAGVTLFGENKVQDFLEKIPALSDLPIEWHFIGQLQSNKVKAILPHVKLIHSLDRISLAEEIQKQAEKLNVNVNALIEINSSGEKNKGGIPLDQAVAFAQELKKYDRIQIQGLMTVAIDGSIEEVRQCFHQTAQLLKEIRPLISGSTLSMGMSGDYPVAIGEGSTLIRLGSSVFGARS